MRWEHQDPGLIPQDSPLPSLAKGFIIQLDQLQEHKSIAHLYSLGEATPHPSTLGETCTAINRQKTTGGTPLASPPSPPRTRADTEAVCSGSSRQPLACPEEALVLGFLLESLSAVALTSQASSMCEHEATTGPQVQVTSPIPALQQQLLIFTCW